jgi:hypothetical protein
MPEILALCYENRFSSFTEKLCFRERLQSIAPLLEKTTLRQMSLVIIGMLTANGRITMLGLSRWAEKGGSYCPFRRYSPGFSAGFKPVIGEGIDEDDSELK